MNMKFAVKMEEHKQFIQNVQNDLEEEMKKRNRDKSNFMIDINNINAKIDRNATDIEQLKESSINLAEISGCLVENAQI